MGHTVEIGDAWVDWAHSMMPETFPSGEPIDAVLEQLTPRERQVAYLMGPCSLTAEETAEVLGCSRPTLRVLRLRIRGKLAPLLRSVA